MAHLNSETIKCNNVFEEIARAAADPAYPAVVRSYARLYLDECEKRGVVVLADIEKHLRRQERRAA